MMKRLNVGLQTVCDRQHCMPWKDPEGKKIDTLSGRQTSGKAKNSV